VDIQSLEKLCFDKLEEQFKYLFEPELIKDICHVSNLKKFEEGETLLDIGQNITHMPLVMGGSIKIMTEDEIGDELLLYYLEFGDTCAVTLNCCTKKTKSTIKAIAEERSEILFIPVEMMERWMIKYHTCH
jgi:CRP/FNR family transcriptional regulator